MGECGQDGFEIMLSIFVLTKCQFGSIYWIAIMKVFQSGSEISSLGTNFVKKS